MSYTLDGQFVREILEVTPGSSRLILEDDHFYMAQNSGLARIDMNGNVTPYGGNVNTGSGLDKFPGGFITTSGGGISIYDDAGQLFSSVDLNSVFDTVAIDDANRIAYLASLSQTFASVDFSDPFNPVILNQGMAAGGLFLADFNPFTGHIFGTSLGVPFEIDTDGSLVTQFFGGDFGFKYGVAVVPVPEPAPTMGTLLVVCLGWRRFGTRR